MQKERSIERIKSKMKKMIEDSREVLDRTEVLE